MSASLAVSPLVVELNASPVTPATSQSLATTEVSSIDLRDVAASFEQLYRQTSALGQLPQEKANVLQSKTALGRFQMFIDDAQPVGRAYNAIRDAVTRGWKEHMHFVEYDDLTARPAEAMAWILLSRIAGSG